MEATRIAALGQREAYTINWTLICVGLLVAMFIVALAWISGFTGAVDEMALAGR